MVKVMATTSPGSSTSARRRRKRRVSRSVLPEPAGACTRMERVESRARARSRWSGGGAAGAILLIVRTVAVWAVLCCVQIAVFANAAQGVESAAVACAWVVAWIGFSAAGDEIRGELF